MGQAAEVPRCLLEARLLLLQRAERESVTGIFWKRRYAGKTAEKSGDFEQELAEVAEKMQNGEIEQKDAKVAKRGEKCGFDRRKRRERRKFQDRNFYHDLRV